MYAPGAQRTSRQLVLQSAQEQQRSAPPRYSLREEIAPLRERANRREGVTGSAPVSARQARERITLSCAGLR